MEQTDQFRLYTWVNCIYMNAVQHGIQSTHVLGRLNRKYFSKFNTDSPAAKMLLDWQFQYETVIVLNGGNLKGIKDVYTLLELYADKCGLPFAKFHEDEDSLGGIMTSCGVVLPASMFGAVDGRRAGEITCGLIPSGVDGFYYFSDPENNPGMWTSYKPTSPEYQIIKAAKSCPLAR